MSNFNQKWQWIVGCVTLDFLLLVTHLALILNFTQKKNRIRRKKTWCHPCQGALPWLDQPTTPMPMPWDRSAIYWCNNALCRGADLQPWQAPQLRPTPSLAHAHAGHRVHGQQLAIGLASHWVMATLSHRPCLALDRCPHPHQTTDVAWRGVGGELRGQDEGSGLREWEGERIIATA